MPPDSSSIWRQAAWLICSTTSTVHSRVHRSIHSRMPIPTRPAPLPWLFAASDAPEVRSTKHQVSGVRPVPDGWRHKGTSPQHPRQTWKIPASRVPVPIHTVSAVLHDHQHQLSFFAQPAMATKFLSPLPPTEIDGPISPNFSSTLFPSFFFRPASTSRTRGRKNAAIRGQFAANLIPRNVRKVRKEASDITNHDAVCCALGREFHLCVA